MHYLNVVEYLRNLICNLDSIFFDASMIPRFSIYIPMNDSGNLSSKLRDYFTDPHMLQIVFYLMICKFPSALVLSFFSERL